MGKEGKEGELFSGGWDSIPNFVRREEVKTHLSGRTFCLFDEEGFHVNVVGRVFMRLRFEEGCSSI